MEEIMNAGTNQAQESVPSGTVQAPAETTLTEMLEAKAEGTENAPQEAEPVQQDGQTQHLNGGIRGRLLESEKKGEKRGYTSGYQAAWQEAKAQIDAMNKQLEELSEYKLKEEAAALAKEEGCSEKLAMRILRAEKGLAPQANAAVQEETEKPRDESGRFVARESKDDGSTQRAQFLFSQAKVIREQTGMDALELFNSADAETREKIARGEMDFNALVLASMSREQRTPPMVKPTSGALTKRISDMTTEDFAKLDAYARKGGAIRIV